MQAGTEEKVKERIVLTSSAEDCHVAGFSDRYAVYLEGPAGDGVHNGWVLMVFGVIILAIGVATLIFGPETVTYSTFSGSNYIQYIQMYPGPITTVGGACVALASSLISKGLVSRETYLQAHYDFIASDGRDVSAEVQVRHLGDDRFHVSVNQ
ncbi:hypothetical protein [Pseudomonas fontis]|uniref:Uncharacterized protein n=1 Tax=Pseudomonas fontis TaxID=2942633 RepID=A0ABT5NW88_9PSED|nr:hypothetical protein [Pseudomonas fontis]MDD0975672.1 hypothetical protein [Pseudomonas fontis]MDD0992428.1 hypothetical protein [Pseudomonas fontis]